MNLYISRANGRLVSQFQAVTLLGMTKARETVTESYCRYGEPVRVKLPAECT